MEEVILKIIQGALRLPHNEEICEDIAAKEIADTFDRFMEWLIKDKEVFYGSLVKKYLSPIDDDLPSTLKELYSYWNEHINENK